MPKTQPKRKDRVPRRRMDPETRRREIIEAARPLFSDRPISQITLADVAEAAGCSRALVHSYFGGIPKLFLAVVAEAGSGLVEARKPRPDASLEERIALNAAESLDIVGQNRETWWGVMGHRTSGDADVDGLARAITEFNVQRVLDNNAGLIEDTPQTRAVVRALIALSTEVTRQWLTDELTREQAEALLTVSYVEILSKAIPEMEKLAKPADGAGEAG